MAELKLAEMFHEMYFRSGSDQLNNSQKINLIEEYVER